MEIIRLLTASKNHHLYNEHHISGLMYEYYPEDQILRTAWLNTMAHNEVLLRYAREMTKNVKNLISLKGVSLLDDIYSDYGKRFMSDIDVLIEKTEVDEARKILTELGFKELKSKKWFGNNFKYEFNKQDKFREVNIEVHTKVLYHEDEARLDFIEQNGLKVYGLEDQIVALIGHLGHSHNFQKLYWLFDIYYYLNKYGEEIDQEKLLSKIKEKKIVKVYQATLYLLKKYFALPLSFQNKVTKMPYYFLLDDEFLLNPNQHELKNYVVKHLLKDSWVLALKYDVLWLKDKLQGSDKVGDKA